MELKLPPMYGTKYSSISFEIKNDVVHIERVHTCPEHRKKGEFKKTLSQFIKIHKDKEITVCVCPDRMPDGEYDYRLQDSIIKTFKSLGFVPTDIGGEFYDTDLELLPTKTKKGKE